MQHNNTHTAKNHLHAINFSRLSIASLFLFLLTACGSGGSGGNGETGGGGSGTANPTQPETPAQPQNVQVLAGNAQVTISWDNVNTATGYDICSATETITQPANCSVQQNGTLAVDQTSPAIISGLSNAIQYFFVVIPKNTNGDGAASAVVSVTTVGPVLPSPTGKLNDTGINLCGDYAFDSGGNNNNNLDCSLTADAEGDPIPVGQDGVSGRDANPATTDNSDGNKGFNYSKLDSNGFALTDQSASTFSCVKDNVTGLIWEVKQTATGLFNKDDTYTWLNTDASNNGGNNGTTNANASCEGNVNNTCNTQAYVAKVNTASLCGASNWRLPTRKELRSLVDYGAPLDPSSPAIDTTYFPNTASFFYWSSSPYAPSSANAWSVSFSNGFGNALNKSGDNRVRLVRSGQ